MKNKENSKGITLIALVITIIVMLILVVVTISVTTEGGLIEKTKEAKNQTQLAAEIEKIDLAVKSALIKGEGILKDEYINESFQEEFGTIPKKIGNNYVYESDITKYIIESSGEIITAKKGYDNAKTIEYSNIGTDIIGIKCSYGSGDTAANITDWQILDIEDGHIYLISKNVVNNPDGVKSFNIPKITDTTQDGEGRYKETAVKYFVNENSIKYDEISQIASKWLSRYVDYIKKRNCWRKRLCRILQR